jgi:hypothetical protein
MSSTSGKEPLICADVVSQICADLRTDGCVNQRFLLPPRKINIERSLYG